MNLMEIREEAWDEALDISTRDADRFWKKREMNRYINRIYRHIARETRCIRDATTPAVCLIASAPVDYTTYDPASLDYIWANDPNNTNLYQTDVAPYLHTLHESIIDVDSCEWSLRYYRLTKVSFTKWEDRMHWEWVPGMPTEYALDMERGKLAVNYRDTESDTLRLKVRRLPLVPLIQDTDVPEFREDYHDMFKHGVLAQMYRKQDAEVYDLNKANDHWGKYLKDVDEIKQAENLLNERLRPNNSLGAFL